MSGGPGHYSDPHSIVEEHYQDIHRQVIIIMMMMMTMTMIMMTMMMIMIMMMIHGGSHRAHPD